MKNPTLSFILVHYNETNPSLAIQKKNTEAFFVVAEAGLEHATSRL